MSGLQEDRGFGLGSWSINDRVELSKNSDFSDTSSMDIKNALNSILPLNLRPKDGVDKSIKMDNTTDRDANGQQQYQSQDQKREPMTDEQIEKALEILRSYPAVKEHNLSIELVLIDNKKFVLLKEPDGKLIRKIAEHELWSLPDMKQWEPPKKGQLLRKTA